MSSPAISPLYQTLQQDLSSLKEVLDRSANDPFRLSSSRLEPKLRRWHASFKTALTPEALEGALKTHWVALNTILQNDPNSSYPHVDDFIDWRDRYILLGRPPSRTSASELSRIEAAMRPLLEERVPEESIDAIRTIVESREEQQNSETLSDINRERADLLASARVDEHRAQEEERHRQEMANIRAETAQLSATTTQQETTLRELQTEMDELNRISAEIDLRLEQLAQEMPELYDACQRLRDQIGKLQEALEDQDMAAREFLSSFLLRIITDIVVIAASGGTLTFEVIAKTILDAFVDVTISFIEEKVLSEVFEIDTNTFLGRFARPSFWVKNGPEFHKIAAGTLTESCTFLEEKFYQKHEINPNLIPPTFRVNKLLGPRLRQALKPPESL